MLPYKNRLTKERDFQKTYKGQGVKSLFFSLRFQKNRLKETRIGVVVGKKVSVKSTKRNRLKRRMREVFKSALPRIEKSFDIAVIAYPQSVNLEFKKIEEDINFLLKKAKLLL